MRNGSKEGATLVTGGERRPQGIEKGYSVRPTVFADVNSRMMTAREENLWPSSVHNSLRRRRRRGFDRQ